MSTSRKRARRSEQQPGRPRCVLDSGGLTALVGGSHRAREWLRWIIEHEGTVTIPTPVLVESTTGHPGRDAEVNRVVAVLQRVAGALEAPTEAIARRAGKLRHRAGHDDGIDALVAASAVGDGSTAILLTSDPFDLGRLLEREPHVEIRKV